MAPQDTARSLPRSPTCRARRSRSSRSTPVRTPATSTWWCAPTTRRTARRRASSSAKLDEGQGTVVMLEGDTASINGRDRTDAFNACMKANYPKHQGPRRGHRVGAADGRLAAADCPHAGQGRPRHLHAVELRSGRDPPGAEAGGPATPRPSDPKHIFIVSNDGIPEELKDIRGGTHRRDRVPAGRPVRQVRPLLRPGRPRRARRSSPARPTTTARSSRSAPGLLEDQLAAPLVTKDNVDDKSLWGNNLERLHSAHRQGVHHQR